MCKRPNILKIKIILLKYRQTATWIFYTNMAKRNSHTQFIWQKTKKILYTQHTYVCVVWDCFCAKHGKSNHKPHKRTTQISKWWAWCCMCLLFLLGLAWFSLVWLLCSLIVLDFFLVFGIFFLVGFWKWNIKWKIDRKCNIYYGGSGCYEIFFYPFFMSERD